jgi:hypothetical protein
MYRRADKSSQCFNLVAIKKSERAPLKEVNIYISGSDYRSRRGAIPRTTLFNEESSSFFPVITNSFFKLLGGHILCLGILENHVGLLV